MYIRSPCVLLNAGCIWHVSKLVWHPRENAYKKIHTVWLSREHQEDITRQKCRTSVWSNRQRNSRVYQHYIWQVSIAELMFQHAQWNRTHLLFEDTRNVLFFCLFFFSLFFTKSTVRSDEFYQHCVFAINYG